MRIDILKSTRCKLPRATTPFPPGLPKQRTRRLRKKLRIGEFRMGFRFSSAVRRDLEVDRELKLRYGFVSHLARHGLSCLGGIEGGFISGSGGSSPTDGDREAVRAWLDSRPEVVSAEVGPLVEAWSAPEERD